MADVFISYSRRDQAFARRLSESLEARGKDVWVDLHDIAPSAPWMAEIGVAIAEAQAVVFVISPDSVASPVCGEELRRSVELNKRLVPVVVRETPIAEVPGRLSALNFLDFSDSSSDDAFQAQLDRLIAALDTDLDAVHLHTRLLLRVSEWEDSGNDPARLLRGRQLDEAEHWLAAQGGRDPAPTPSQVRLVLASRRAAVRRQRGSLAVALAVVMGMIGLSTVAVLQWHAAVVQRAQANSRADAAEAETLVQVDPPRALDLALQGIRTSDTDEVQTALRDAVQASVLRAVLPPMKLAQLAAARSGDGSGGSGELAIDPSGTYVALANTAAGVEVWRWRAGAGRGSYSDPYRLVLPGAAQAVFVEGGRQLLVADNNGTLLKWEWRTANRATVLRRGLKQPVLSQDGTLLADFSLSLSPQTVSVTEAVSGKTLATIAAGVIDGVSFSPDGALIATWDESNGPLKLWRTDGGRFVENIDAVPFNQANTGSVPVAISPGDDRIAVSNGNSISIYSVVNPRRAPKVLSLSAPPGAFADGGGDFNAGSLAWSPNGEELAEGGKDEALRLWSGNLGGQTFLGPVDDGAGGIAFSPDGQHLVSSDNVGGTSVWSWAADTTDDLSVRSYVQAAVISPNGSMVAYATDGTVSATPVLLWDWHNFRLFPLTSTTGFGQISLVFSPNSRWLAVSSPGNLSVWDVSSRRRLASLPLPGYESQAAYPTFDASGRILAATELLQQRGSAGDRDKLISWRWGSSAPAGFLGGFKKAEFVDLAISHVDADGSLRFVYGRDYLSWGGKSSDRSSVLRRNAMPAGSFVPGSAFFDGGKRLITVTGPAAHQTTEVFNLLTGAHSRALSQLTMGGGFVASPDGQLVAGSAANGDVVVWDEKPGDVPASVPTAVPLPSVALSAQDMLINEGTVLYVLPDLFCQPLSALVPLAKSLLVRPSSLAEAMTYNA